MKKFVALLLVLAMALSLCTTAFAGSAAETAVLRLTGDAADEVVNLKDGQHVSAKKDVAVRLNVQSDPGAAEYTVTLDGETVEADHSTAQYHFYYLPAAQLSGVSTLSVSTQADVGTDAVSIATAEDLASFRDRVNNGETTLNARLTADIDLGNAAWTPIGTSSTMYAGIFDGDGHTISGLTVTGGNNGLFKMTGNATIQNLTISDSTIGKAGNEALLGAFVGRIKGSTTLINCHTTDTVTVLGGTIGGLVGGTDTANVDFVLTMTRCSNAATVTGNAPSGQMGVGGLVGVLHNGAVITDSFNTGAVTNKSTGSSAAVGGLIGNVFNNSDYKNRLTLTNVYNTGVVTAGGSTELAGGLVGSSTWGFDITNAYGTMTVKTGEAYGGIIVGTVKNTVNVDNVYIELIREMNNDCKASLNDSGGKMKDANDEQHRLFNDTEMKAADKLLAKLGETFAEDTANINNGYPVLAWQNAAPESASQLTVSVGGVEKPVTLPADGSTSAASPTAVTVEFENPGEDAVMDRIYFTDLAEGVSLGTGLNKDSGSITGALTQLDAGYTGDQMYFYKTPAAITNLQQVKAAWTDGEGTTRYYNIKVTRAAQSGYALEFGVTSMGNESAPIGVNSYVSGSEYLSAIYASYAYLALYKDGKNVKGNIKPSFPTDTTGLYYSDAGGTNIYFARPGRYWVPVSAEQGGTTYTGSAPILVTWALNALNGHLDEARAVQSDESFAALPENLRTQFNAVVERLTAAAKGNISAKVMLTAAGTIAGADETATDIQARDLGGKQLFSERLLEADECALQDLMAIIAAYKTDKTMGQYQMEAYEKIAALGLCSFTEVTSLAEKEMYSAYKQAKWDVIHAADLTAINAILTGLKLEAITPAEPEVMLGDINGDGQITLKDATLLLQHVNEIITLTAEQLAAADINGDGQITLKDATLLLQFVNEIIPALPAGKAN